MNEARKPKSSLWVKLILATAVLAGIAVAYTIGNALSLEQLATKESDLRQFQRENPLLVYGLAFLVYVTVTGLSLPGATGLSLLYGWYFGLWRGVVLVSFSSTTGATLAFILSRYLLRDAIHNRFGDRLSSFNSALEREGAFYLFTLRLIPAVPFFVINVVMGLTPILARTFWWVSQIGMLPGTIVYVYAGSSVPDLTTLADDGVGGILSTQLIFAFVLLGVIPLAIKKALERTKAAPANATDSVGKPAASESSLESSSVGNRRL